MSESDWQGEVNVLEEAHRLVDKDRTDDYGHPSEYFGQIAVVWGELLDCTITPEQVVLCMVLVKVMRENNKPKRDNVVDIAGYARVLEMVQRGLP